MTWFMSFVRKRVVIDSNVIISAALYPKSPAASAYMAADLYCDLYASQDTLAEVEHVLMRSKFDRYFPVEMPTRERFLADYRDRVIEVKVTETISDCPDPKDNQFLSLALTVNADFIVTGDRKHLLPMHPYHGIAILSCDDFLRMTLGLGST
jgi:putative PIN family toxin of toxin-antitoxin system